MIKEVYSSLLALTAGVEKVLCNKYKVLYARDVKLL